MIISGMEKQKRYKHVSDDDKLLISEWTSTETVERPDNITNKDRKDIDATTLDHTYDNNNSVPTKLTDFITKSTAFFNNIRFVKNVLTTFTGANTDNTAEQMAQAMYNKIYPIGSLYWSSNPTNPQTLFGGTWVQVKDKFIMAAGDTYQAGTSGGSATITPSGTVNSRSITLQEANIPKHRHSVSAIGNISTGSGGTHSHTYTYPSWVSAAEGSGSRMEVGKTGSWGTYNVGGNGAHSHTITVPAHNTNYTGSTTAFSHDHTFTGNSANNLPPYTAYYCWERTA